MQTEYTVELIEDAMNCTFDGFGEKFVKPSVIQNIDSLIQTFSISIRGKCHAWFTPEPEMCGDGQDNDGNSVIYESFNINY